MQRFIFIISSKNNKHRHFWINHYYMIICIKYCALNIKVHWSTKDTGIPLWDNDQYSSISNRLVKRLPFNWRHWSICTTRYYKIKDHVFLINSTSHLHSLAILLGTQFKYQVGSHSPFFYHDRFNKVLETFLHACSYSCIHAVIAGYYIIISGYICIFLIWISSSSTSQRCSTGLRSLDGGGLLSLSQKGSMFSSLCPILTQPS